MLLRIPLLDLSISLTGLSPYFVSFPNDVKLSTPLIVAVLQPRRINPTVWAVLLSLAATQGIALLSSP